MVEEPIEERGDGGGIAQELAPVFHRAVGRDERGGALVAAHDDLEEILGGGVGELAHVEIVDDEQRDGGELGEVGLTGAAELVEERVGFTVEDAMAPLEDREADRRVLKTPEWNTFVASRTRFANWDAIVEAAGGEWALKQLKDKKDSALRFVADAFSSTLQGAT